MKSKKLLKIVMMFLAIGFALPVAATVPNPSGEALPVDDGRNIYQMPRRLEEINSMDIGQLSREERKALRKEVKQIRSELKTEQRRGGGLYISLGAALVIIVLLLLLL